MKNPKIAEVLKKYRKHNKLSVNDVMIRLGNIHLPVALKTIYGWESGQSQPDADTFLVLCKIYKIDNILEAFGYVEEPTEHLMLTDEELQLVKRFRERPEMQTAIRKLLDI